MNIVAKFPLDESQLAYLQMLTYRMDGLRVLNCQIIRSGKPDHETYERFLEEYKAACAEQHFAFSELSAQYAKAWPEIDYVHSVRFDTGELVIYERERRV